MNKKYLLITLAIVSAGLLYKRSVRSMEPMPEFTIMQYVQQYGFQIDENGMWNLRFKGITSLEGLDQPEQLDFDPSAVKTLDLSGNYIQEIPRGIFARFYNLEGLSLYDNRISIIYGVTEHGVQSLRALARLRELGEETSIQQGSFSGLTNLQGLHLGDNQLKSLPVGSFSGLTNLQDLGLANNQLKSLPVGIFVEPTNLQAVELGRNPLVMTLDQIIRRCFPAGRWRKY